MRAFKPCLLAVLLTFAIMTAQPLARAANDKEKAAPTLRRKPREDGASGDDTKDKPTLKRKNGGD